MQKLSEIIAGIMLEDAKFVTRLIVYCIYKVLDDLSKSPIEKTFILAD